ncbi:retron St85 family effector protein [Janthinobacterium sp. SUN176]|uniref:retron St85 family effector protein n=1 Tax=Janthinobacterium sp. SUN176 TaxID=3014788 RepID=UPI0027130DFC|nr:retron St85 family effector protein [Janthinobacterium sp. SUN176]MDO8072833.1 retron St85 family effector protein [Janthinobacterium sp. SUN176]
MDFEDTIIEEFSSLDVNKFTAVFTPPKIFLCGGPTRAAVAESVRQRIIDHLSVKDPVTFDALIHAEDFTDYFKDGIYSDLLDFEIDIANLSSLTVVCLESPGAFVELGIFCQLETVSGKLLIIAPQEETDKKDSFIYHGPLTSLSRKDNSSVVSYPWADPNILKYDHLEFIIADIMTKLTKVNGSHKFNPKNSGHLALLLYDIICLASPIKKEEINLALYALDIDMSERAINKLLYLLEKVKLIASTNYSRVDYYYGVGPISRRIKFGTSKAGAVKDTSALKMAFRQSYVLAADEPSKKRRYAQQVIQKTGNKK